MSEAIDPEFLPIYVDECGEAFADITECLLELESDPTNTDVLSRAFRAIHTFKGSSAMLGFSVVTALAHEVESRFDQYRDGRDRLTPAAVSLTLRCVDYFTRFVDRLNETGRALWVVLTAATEAEPTVSDFSSAALN